MKYNKFETKVLFLIKESVAEMQNILIEDSAVMSSIRLNNSAVRILNTKMVGNSFWSSFNLYYTELMSAWHYARQIFLIIKLDPSSLSAGDQKLSIIMSVSTFLIFLENVTGNLNT